MIKAKLHNGNKQTILLMFAAENLRRMKEGDPVWVHGQDLEVDFDILISWGNSWRTFDNGVRRLIRLALTSALVEVIKTPDRILEISVGPDFPNHYIQIGYGETHEEIIDALRPKMNDDTQYMIGSPERARLLKEAANAAKA